MWYLQARWTWKLVKKIKCINKYKYKLTDIKDEVMKFLYIPGGPEFPIGPWIPIYLNEMKEKLISNLRFECIKGNSENSEWGDVQSTFFSLTTFFPSFSYSNFL